MATAAWPGTLPQYFRRSDFSAQRKDDRARFQGDKGPPIVGPSLMLRYYLYTASMEVTLAQKVILDDFWDDDLIEGTQPFTFPIDPLTGSANVLLKFDTPPSYPTRIGPSHWVVSMQLWTMP